jgi:two-component system LytT family response regulator
VIERVLIVDDEPLARERLRDLVRAAAASARIEEATDGDAAVERIAAWKPQVVFLDIQMPRRDGFAVVAAIGPAEMPPVAFVTAFDEHAIRAFDVSAVDYLLKPFDDARFTKTWQRLERAHAAASLTDDARKLGELLAAVAGVATAAPPGRFLERFLVRVDERTFPVPVHDVRWMQSEGNYVELHTAAGKHTVRESLAHLEDRLDPARFVRIHRSVIVALDQIKEMQPWFAGDQVLILRDGTKLRVSRTRRAALAARLAGEG